MIDAAALPGDPDPSESEDAVDALIRRLRHFDPPSAEELNALSEHELRAYLERKGRLESIEGTEPGSTFEIPERLAGGDREDPQSGARRSRLEDRYHLEFPPLGRGSQGEVYRAMDSELGRWVAVKLLSVAALSSDPESRKRMREEVDALTRVSIDGVVRVLDADLEAVRPYIVMEFLDGKSLRTVMEGAGRPQGPCSLAADWKNRLSMIEALARSLDQVHQKGLIHRDVKPSNIMLSQGPKLVLIDFGLARPEDQADVTHSRVGIAVGTFRYLAPEIHGPPSVPHNHRTDLFALGVVLHEWLTGEHPFPGATEDAVRTAVLHDEPVALKQRCRGMSEDMRIVLGTILAKDPNRRYASGNAFANDLEALLLGRPILARAPSLLYRVKHWVKQHPGRAVATVAAVIIASLLGWAVPKAIESRGYARAARVEEAVDIGYLALSGADPIEARAAFHRALAEDDACVEAMIGLALTDFRADRRSDVAQKTLDRYRERLTSLGATFVLRTVESEIDESQSAPEWRSARVPPDLKPSSPIDFFVHGTLHRFRGRSSGKQELLLAREDLEEAMRRSRGPRALFVGQLASTTAQLDDEPGSRRLADLLVFHWPRSPYAWAQRGFVLSRIDVEDSIAAHRMAIELDPDKGSAVGRAYANISTTLGNCGRVAESLVEADHSIVAAPDRDFGYATRALALERLGRLDEAVTAAKKAVSYGDLLGTGHKILSRDARRRGDFAAADELASETIRRAGDLAAAFIDRANGRIQAGRFADARKDYEYAASMGPLSANDLNSLGTACGQSGDTRRAIEIFRDLSARKAPDMAWLANLGVMQYDEGEILEACKALRTAFSGGHRDAGHLYMLGSCLFELGLPAEGAQMLEESVKRGFDRTGAAQLRDEIERFTRSGRESSRPEEMAVWELSSSGQVVEAARALDAIDTDLPRALRALPKWLQLEAVRTLLRAGSAVDAGPSLPEADFAERCRTAALSYLDAWIHEESNFDADGKPRRAFQRALRILELSRAVELIRTDAYLATLAPNERASWKRFWNELDRLLSIETDS